LKIWITNSQITSGQLIDVVYNHTFAKIVSVGAGLVPAQCLPGNHKGCPYWWWQNYRYDNWRTYCISDDINH